MHEIILLEKLPCSALGKSRSFVKQRAKQKLIFVGMRLVFCILISSLKLVSHVMVLVFWGWVFRLRS